MTVGTLAPKGYRPRLIEPKLDSLMQAFGCVEINGPKWCGKTWTAIGDADYFYGSVTEDGSSISYFPGALEIRDGYVYTTAVYDIDHQKTSDPLVTHSVRVNLKTGAQEILD